MKILYKPIQYFSPKIPEGFRTFIRQRISLQDYDLIRRKAANPYSDIFEKNFPNSTYRFGIIEDVAQSHKYYIAACHDMKLSYKVISILSDDWINIIRHCNCDAFLVWPSTISTTTKQTFDYRLHILERDLGMIIYPSWRECWLSEHKPRLRDWLDAHSIPHPQTWVYHNRQDAIEFAYEAPIPIVAKTATGASASGIKILYSNNELIHHIRKAFGRGLCPRSFDPRDRQRGFIFLQEYLPEVDEWRMVRIGDSFFGYRKERGPKGLHSASHTWSWLNPRTKLLNLAKKVTDTGGFTSMDVDIFLTMEGRLLVNECQAVFGCSTPAVQMKVNDIEGRYLWTDNSWHFERGSFCANHMCNLRLKYLLSVLKDKN